MTRDEYNPDKHRNQREELKVPRSFDLPERLSQLEATNLMEKILAIKPGDKLYLKHGVEVEVIELSQRSSHPQVKVKFLKGEKAGQVEAQRYSIDDLDPEVYLKKSSPQTPS